MVKCHQDKGLASQIFHQNLAIKRAIFLKYKIGPRARGGRCWFSFIANFGNTPAKHIFSWSGLSPHHHNLCQHHHQQHAHHHHVHHHQCQDVHHEEDRMPNLMQKLQEGFCSTLQHLIGHPITLHSAHYTHIASTLHTAQLIIFCYIVLDYIVLCYIHEAPVLAMLGNDASTWTEIAHSATMSYSKLHCATFELDHATLSCRVGNAGKGWIILQDWNCAQLCFSASPANYMLLH